MNKHGIATGKPIQINESIAKSCFDIYGICGGAVNIDTEDIVMKIRRAGSRHHVIEYPVFEITDDKLCFYWDSLLHDLPKGRYIGDLFFGKNKVSEVQFERDFTINLGAVTNTERLRGTDCD